MQTESLVPASAVKPSVVTSVISSPPTRANVPHKPAIEPAVSLDELLANAGLQGRGWRGWLRVAQVSRVLGLMTLYLFLDSYDVRAKFLRRTADRLREEASGKGWKVVLRTWFWNFGVRVLDRGIRGLRYFVFRGSDGSDKKEARLARQAEWLRKNLIILTGGILFQVRINGKLMQIISSHTPIIGRTSQMEK